MDKQKLKYHLKSSAYTFFTFFLPVLAVSFQEIDFSSLEAAGLIGAFAALFRLLLKASWAGIVGLVVWAAKKIKKK